jgi:hypothetical protein
MKRTMKKTLAILLTLCALAAAQDKPKVGVYVTHDGAGGFPAKVLAGTAAPVVGEALVKAINITGKGNAVNMTKEISKEFGSSVGAGQAATVAGKFGLQSLCVVTISNINIAAKSFGLSVKMFDVAGTQTASGPLSGGAAQVTLTDPIGIAKAMTEITVGLVTGLAVSAVKTAATGQPAAPAAAAPVAMAASPAAAPGQAAPVAYAAAPAAPAEPPAPPAPVAIPMHERPWIAVYARGRAKDDEIKTSFGPELLFALAKTGRYRAIESNAEFAAKVQHEAEKLGAGLNLTDRQIAMIAANADFICVVDVATVLGSYQVFARIINVKTLEAAEMGKTIGTIATADDVPKISDKLVESLFGVSDASMPAVQQLQQQVAAVQTQMSQVQQEVQQQVQQAMASKPAGGGGGHVGEGEVGIGGRAKIEAGIGMSPFAGYAATYKRTSWTYDNYYGWRPTYHPPEEDDTSSSGLVHYFRADLVYAELSYEYYYFNNIDDMGRMLLDWTVLLKYPFGNQVVQGTPLVGATISPLSLAGAQFNIGGRLDIHLGDIAYLRSEFVYGFWQKTSSTWSKSGIGFNINLGERCYLHPEIMYSWKGITEKDENNYETSRTEYEYTRSLGTLDIRLGVGYKF